MAFETEFSLYFGLGLLVIGTGFFKPNMVSFVSEMYKYLPEKKDAAYTIFYMGVNSGSFFGMMLFSIVTGLFALFTIAGMIASQDTTKEPEDNSVLVLNLSGQMSERSENNFLSQLQGSQINSLGLDDMLEGIRKAKDNDKIKGIYIEAGAFASDSYASMQALRKALLDFKKSRKWIIAYADTYTQGTYYLSSVADKVYLNPQGQIDWHGLASEPVFIKDLLAKFGVKMQVVKVGAYKSATEMFTGDKMSDANREQTSAYLNSIWGNITKEVGASRGLSVAQLNAYADSMITFADPQEYVKLKLVDGLVYTDQIKGIVKKQLGIETDKDINQVTIADMVNTEDNNQGDKENEVAVYYAYGDIVDGVVGGLFSQDHQIDAQVVCKDLEKLAKDKDVKKLRKILAAFIKRSNFYNEQVWYQVEVSDRMIQLANLAKKQEKTKLELNNVNASLSIPANRHHSFAVMNITNSTTEINGGTYSITNPNKADANGYLFELNNSTVTMHNSKVLMSDSNQDSILEAFTINQNSKLSLEYLL